MAARISSSVFPMLGAEPMLGRTFTIGEDALGQKRRHPQLWALAAALWR